MKKNENKYLYLFKNVGLLTISNFGSKILSIILIPIYTSILTTEEYGTYDLYSTTISLLIPILTLNVVEAVLRFTLDKEKDKTHVFSIGFFNIIVASIIFAILIFFNTSFDLVPIFNEYYLCFYLLFIGNLFYTFLNSFARGVEKVLDVAIAGFINSIVMLVCNIIFLVPMNLGLRGYFWAFIISYLIPAVYLFFRLKVWKYLSLRKINKDLNREMYSYSAPLIFNEIGWWITNVSDRYIVTWIKGVAENGIYSVAYKIPSILNVFQTIFGQAWALSSVKEFTSEKDRSVFYSNIYSLYNCGMVIVCSALLIANQIIAKLLFANEYFSAWQFAPYLMVSTVFGAMSGFLGGIFAAAKKSKVFAISTIIGAVINIVLNFILVYFIGTIGAAISTLVSYVIIWIIRLAYTNKIVVLKLNYLRDFISYVFIIGQATIWIIDFDYKIKYIIQGVLFMLILVLYLKEMKTYISKLYGKLKLLKRRKGDNV